MAIQKFCMFSYSFSLAYLEWYSPLLNIAQMPTHEIFDIPELIRF